MLCWTCPRGTIFGFQNILESSKENKQILEKLFKNDKFLDKFLSYTTDTLKTDASYEALKSNIINASKFLNKVISSKSIDVNKSDELFGLLLENGAILNEIDDKVFENNLKFVPHGKMSEILKSTIDDEKIKIAAEYAVKNLKKDDFRDVLLALTDQSTVAIKAVIKYAVRNLKKGDSKDDFKKFLLDLTNRSTVARNAVIETVLNKNKKKLLDVLSVDWHREFRNGRRVKNPIHHTGS